VPTPLGHLFSLMVRPHFLSNHYDLEVVLISGLTAQQAMGCVVVGAMITGILSVLSGAYSYVIRGESRLICQVYLGRSTMSDSLLSVE